MEGTLTGDSNVLLGDFSAQLGNIRKTLKGMIRWRDLAIVNLSSVQLIWKGAWEFVQPVYMSFVDLVDVEVQVPAPSAGLQVSRGLIHE